MTLDHLSCTPCRGGIPAMTPAEAEEKLAQLPGWELNASATTLERRFGFKNFVQALSFANRVGEVAEKEGHHPEMTIGWGFCRVLLFTHKIGGLHENDFILAAKISRLVADKQ